MMRRDIETSERPSPMVWVGQGIEETERDAHGGHSKGRAALTRPGARHGHTAGRAATKQRAVSVKGFSEAEGAVRRVADA